MRYLYVGVPVEHTRTLGALPRTTADVAALGVLLRPRGYIIRDVPDPADVSGLEASLGQVVDGPDASGEVVLLHWAGHGAVDGEGNLRLILGSGSTGKLATVRPGDLFEFLAERGVRNAFLVFDTCHSGAGLRGVLDAADVQARVSEAGMWVGVVASTLSYQDAVGGRLAETFERLLRDGPTDPLYKSFWDSPFSEGVPGVVLLEQLMAEWTHDSQGLAQGTYGSRSSPIVLPNPKFQSDAAPRIVDPRPPTHQFVGRTGLLAEIDAWVGRGAPGVRLIVGSPGAGKTSVMGQVARARYIGDRQVVVLAGGSLGSQVLDQFAQRLGVRAPRSVYELLREPTGPQPPALILFDALDEVPRARRTEVTRLLRALSLQALVLVSSRPLLATHDGRDLLDALGSPDVAWDLDIDPQVESDITRYAFERLSRSDDAGVGELAAAVARRAVGGGGGFLYAQIVTSLLTERDVDPSRPGWQQQLDVSTTEAFSQALDVLAGSTTRAEVDSLLMPLAGSFGNGLPAGDLWLPLANRIRPDRPPFTLADAGETLQRFGRFIEEGSEAGEQVFRLFHLELATSVVERDPERFRATDQAVADLWQVQTSEGRHPEHSQPYLQTYALRHAKRLGSSGIDVVRRMAETNPAAYTPSLAEILHDTALTLGEAGDLRNALPRAAEATQIFRSLAAGAFSSHGPALAESLNTLAALSTGLGDESLTVEAASEAVDVYARLDDEWPLEYRPDYARGLDSLARLCLSFGRPEDAHKAAQRLVELVVEPAGGMAAPDAGAAAALALLARSARASGRIEESSLATERALEHCRRLLEQQAWTFTADQAESLDSIAVVLGDLGRYGDAVVAADRAATISEHLYHRNPARYGALLAASRHTLVRSLIETKQDDHALAVAHQIVELYEHLTGEHPAHRANLASAVHDLGIRYHAVGHHDAAVDAHKRAVTLHAELAAGGHAVSRQRLAQSLDDLMHSLDSAGRSKEREARYDVAVYDADPAVAAYLLLARAVLQPSRAAEARIADALSALQLAGAVDPELASEAREVCRRLRADYGSAFDQLWLGRYGSLPDWLGVAESRQATT